MNPGINIISAFRRSKDENGNDLFTGTIDLTALKKMKKSEIDVVLVPIESVPHTLGRLITPSAISDDGLIMFAGDSGDGPIRDERKGIPAT